MITIALLSNCSSINIGNADIIKIDTKLKLESVDRILIMDRKLNITGSNGQMNGAKL